jgi:hypothetical protein
MLIHNLHQKDEVAQSISRTADTDAETPTFFVPGNGDDSSFSWTGLCVLVNSTDSLAWVD